MDPPLEQRPPGRPYAPTSQGAGGRPTVGVDVPVSAVFMFLFVISAVIHMTIFQLNRRKGHKFILSAVTFGFSMARIVTFAVRIAWASNPENTSLSIAAQIFVSAGVLLLFIINLIFAQRILRAQHPGIGWNPILSWAFKFFYFSIVGTLIIVITATVQSFYTMDQSIRSKDRSMQRFGAVYLAFISFLPLPMLAVSYALPPTTPLDNFGTGRFNTKIAIVVTAASVLVVGACYRCANAFRDPTPLDAPTPWYLSRAAFYNFNFTIELCVAYFYALVRIDRRFWVPNGARGPGSYGGRTGPEADPASEKDVEDRNGDLSPTDRIEKPDDFANGRGERGLLSETGEVVKL